MTRPARLAVGAAIGALAVGAIGGPAALALASASLVLVLAVAGKPGGTAGALPVVIGALAVSLRGGFAAPQPGPVALPSGSGPWDAVVESVSSPRDGARPAIVAIADQPGLRLAATLPWYPEVAPGDRIRIDGAPRVAAPGDYADYLGSIGVSGTIRVRRLELAPLDAGGGPTWEGFRALAAAALARAVPEPEAGLAAGIVVGLRDHVDRDLAAAFTTAGVSHIVAISGWNIAIVATTLGAMTGGLRRRQRAIATGLAIAAYVAFVGPSPSVIRAAAMAGCALLARELGRPAGAASAMGLAVTGLLLLDPGNVDDPGFRLSVLATAGLIAWGTPLSRRLAGPRPGRIRAWLAESLGISLAAQAATLPVILLDFGRLSIVSPGVNLVATPLVAPAMAAAGLALAGGLVTVVSGWGAVATLAGLPAWLLLGAIVAVVRASAGLPFASLSLEPPANVVAAAVSALIILGLASAHRLRWTPGWPRSPGRRRASPDPPHAPPTSTRRAGSTRPAERGRRITALLLGASAVAVALAAIHRPDGATRITVLAIGQGDAILVEGSRGGRLLIDGGPDPGRLLIALDARLPPWDRRIDAIVLTHPHEDHVAGLPLVLERFRVDRVFEAGMRGPGPGYAAWDAALGAHGGRAPPRDVLRTGDRLTVDDLGLRVLWPDEGAVPEEPGTTGTAINNVSIVLLGEVAGHRVLLTGDAESAVEATLVSRGLPRVDLLKVGHHGSSTSTTGELLAATQPRAAIVSVGAGNRYGHPNPEVMARLRASGAEVYRTDHDGSVTAVFDGPTMGIEVGGGRTATAAGGTAEAPRYHRLDVDPHATRGGPPPPVPGPASVARAALPRRRRGRGVARSSCRRIERPSRGARGLPCRPRARRGGRAPP